MQSVTTQPTYPRRARHVVWSRVWIHAVLLFLSFLFLLPLLVVVSASLSSEQALARDGYGILPREFTTYTYEYLLREPGQIVDGYKVTILVTVVGTAVGVLVMALLAYVLSRSDFLLRKPLSFYVLFTLLFNGGLVPSYILVTQYLHLKNSYLALILPYLVVPWFVLLLRTYFAGLPRELIDAAKMDGAGEWRIFFQIVVPLSTPAIATVALFSALLYWNDWFLALLYIDTPSMLPLQYLLYRISTNISFLNANAQLFGVPVPAQSAQMAIAVLAVGPIVFVFLFVQKYFVRGITLGGVKDG